MRASPPKTTSNPTRTPPNSNWRHKVDLTAFGLTIFLLAAVPLIFSTAVYRIYSLPKFALLLTGASALIPLLVLSTFAPQHGPPQVRLLASRHVLLISLFSIVIAISTIFGAAPVAGLFGSSYNQMGLITYVCFVIVFASLIVTNGASESRFRVTLWAMTLTGLAVSTYAFVQFFGRDPFLDPQLYTFASEGGPITRIGSTIGHSDYLGNFLLYVAPIGAGLALSSRGRARRIGFMTAGLSTLAIVFTGTRGAWLGLVVATLTFCALTKSRLIARFAEQSDRRRIIRWGGLVVVLVLILFVIVAVNPASRSIMQRAKSLLHETTGSGRTLLWRDSIKMIPEYAVLGCGVEGFRKAFLPYKSISLAQLAPDTNNESSHNSYIDSAVSYGLPGAILYVAIIASSFWLLMKARRRTTAKGTRIILESLVSSLAAVVAHNFFIFDQISTGLFFFALAALAQVAGYVVSAETSQERVLTSATSSSTADHARNQDDTRKPGSLYFRSAALPFGAGCVLFCLAGWYSIGIVQADLEINRTIASAFAGNLRGLLEHGNRAIDRPDPAGDYRFMFARLLTLYADNSSAFAKTSPVDADSRTQAITMARSYAEQSAIHSNTPDSNYVLLAYLALQLGHYDEALAYADKAIQADPNFSNSHWLMAEAYLGRDQREEAANEARFALDLNPNSREARSAFIRAMGIPQSGNPAELIRYGNKLASQGKIDKALRILKRVVRRANGHCPECRSALASLYETANLYPEAISEWQAYATEAPERALSEKTALRVEKLREAMLKTPVPR